MFNKHHKEKIKSDNVEPDRRCPESNVLPQCAPQHLMTHFIVPLPSRPNHFVQTKNLPYSLKEIKITSKCSVCCECKPQFYCPENVPLIKAFQTFKRINIYFKAPPLTSNRTSTSLWCQVDEYSRFPFVFPCPDVLTSMVIMCLTSLFSFVWIPAYVYSDLRASFMSREFQHFLTTKWVATGKTISYNPERNGEAERGSRVLWKAKNPKTSHLRNVKMSSWICCILSLPLMYNNQWNTSQELFWFLSTIFLLCLHSH